MPSMPCSRRSLSVECSIPPGFGFGQQLAERAAYHQKKAMARLQRYGRFGMEEAEALRRTPEDLRQRYNDFIAEVLNESTPSPSPTLSSDGQSASSTEIVAANVGFELEKGEVEYRKPKTRRSNGDHRRSDTRRLKYRTSVMNDSALPKSKVQKAKLVQGYGFVHPNHLMETRSKRQKIPAAMRQQLLSLPY